MNTSEGLGEEPILEDYAATPQDPNANEDEDDFDNASLGFDPLADQLKDLGLDKDDYSDAQNDQGILSSSQREGHKDIFHPEFTREAAHYDQINLHSEDPSNPEALEHAATQIPQISRRLSLSRELMMNQRSISDQHEEPPHEIEGSGSFSAPPSFGRSSGQQQPPNTLSASGIQHATTPGTFLFPDLVIAHSMPYRSLFLQRL